MRGPAMVEVTVRLTEAELGLVQRLAALKDQSVSDMIREASNFVPESALLPLEAPEPARSAQDAS
jgi:Ribbon-helix-helix protein, copG family